MWDVKTCESVLDLSRNERQSPLTPAARRPPPNVVFRAPTLDNADMALDFDEDLSLLGVNSFDYIRMVRNVEETSFVVVSILILSAVCFILKPFVDFVLEFSNNAFTGLVAAKT